MKVGETTYNNDIIREPNLYIKPLYSYNPYKKASPSVTNYVESQYVNHQILNQVKHTSEREHGLYGNYLKRGMVFDILV